MKFGGRGAEARRGIAWLVLPLLGGAWLTLLAPALARADLESLSAGAGFAVPMGTDYQVYGRYPTFLADGIFRTGMPEFKLIGTAEVSIATVNNTTVQTTRLWMYAAYAGVRYETPPSPGQLLTPYFGLQLGGMYDVLGFSGPTNVDQDSGFEFAARMSPGFDFWLTPKFAVDLGFPLEFLAVKDALFIWDATLSVRVKL